MTGLTIKTAQRFFLDSKAVIASLDKAERRVLSKFGAFVRRSAQSSMRKVNKKGTPSPPGQPPKARKGFLKKFLYFVFDPAAKSVVVGPVLLPGKAGRNSDTVPATLETGGTLLVNEAARRDGSWSRRGTRWAKLNGQATRTRKARVEPRPFMAPAYAKNKPKFMGMWRDAMHRN